MHAFLIHMFTFIYINKKPSKGGILEIAENIKFMKSLYLSTACSQPINIDFMIEKIAFMFSVLHATT